MDLHNLLWNLAVLALVAAGFTTIVGWKSAQSKLLGIAARLVGLSLAIHCLLPVVLERLSALRDEVPVSVTRVPPLAIEVPAISPWVWGILIVGHVAFLVVLLRRRRAAVEERRRAWVDFEQARNRGRSTAFPTDFGGRS